jgi:hypothetical protein
MLNLMFREKLVKVKGSSTSNLLRHMNRWHKTLLLGNEVTKLTAGQAAMKNFLMNGEVSSLPLLTHCTNRSTHYHWF